MDRGEWLSAIALAGVEPDELLEAMRVYRMLAHMDGETVTESEDNELQQDGRAGAAMAARHAHDNRRNI